MESIKEALAALAVSCAVGGIVWLTVPSGNMEKTVRTVVGLFICCVAITPFLNAESVDIYKDFADISFEESAVNEELYELVKLQYERAVNEEVSAVVNDAVSGLGVQAEGISVEADVKENGCINISSICIFVEDEFWHSAESVKNTVEQKTGIPVEVKMR